MGHLAVDSLKRRASEAPVWNIRAGAPPEFKPRAGDELREIQRLAWLAALAIASFATGVRHSLAGFARGEGACYAKWMSHSRREFVAGAAATRARRGAGCSAPKRERRRQAALLAKPPPGFTPLSAPGKVIKVAAKGDFASIMQPNQLWPQAGGGASRLLEKAMMEFTGAANLTEAMKQLHPQGRRRGDQAERHRGPEGHDAWPRTSS